MNMQRKYFTVTVIFAELAITKIQIKPHRSLQ